MHAGGRPASQPRSPLGQRIAAAREQAGISQAHLAERLGVTQPTVAYWERHGREHPVGRADENHPVTRRFLTRMNF